MLLFVRVVILPVTDDRRSGNDPVRHVGGCGSIDIFSGNHLQSMLYGFKIM